jgi:2-polyprenyl-3-methyl-5-hydroxy-6-metoxy-1,4-benzoquinol methylase
LTSDQAPTPEIAAWDSNAEAWAERVRTGTDHNRIHVLDPATLDLLGDVDGKQILDLGCGEGRFCRILAQRGASLTGVDLSSRMIELACEAEAREPLGVGYYVADAADLSFLPESSYDVVLAYLSLFDVPDYQSAIREAARVLVASGRFVFSISHPCFTMPGAGWETRYPNSFRDQDRLFYKVDDYLPARSYEVKIWPTFNPIVNHHRPLSEYAHALKAAGFVIRDIFEPTPDAKLVEQLDFWRGYFRIAVFIMFECEKASP